jgi:hypothetical protein
MSSKARKVIETLMMVYDKEGNLVPFKFNDIQAKIDDLIIEPIERFRELGFEVSEEWIQETIRACILKYRQGGVTTLIMAWFLVECMTRYSVCVMLTHDKEHSEKLLYRARLMLKNLKGPSPKTSKLNDNEIAFAKTDSVFYIGTAGSKEFGRSATITHLHCSEIAFWKDPASLMKSLFQAVPKRSGIIIQETTANGWGNWLQKSYYAYRSGKGGFKAFFFAWYIHNEYISSTPWIKEWDLQDYTEFKLNDSVIQVPNEKIVYKRILKYSRANHLGWSREYICQKLQWRREKILENVGDKSFRHALKDFNQEYPSTYDEAFVVTGGSLFGDVRVVESSKWVSTGPNACRLLPHPVAGFEYTLGGDYAGGTGNDSSSINVLCLNTKEQVYRYADNQINPIDFAHKICEVGHEFNEAYLVPESNNHGLSGNTIVKRNYTIYRIYKHIINQGPTNAERNIPTYGYGWKTTAQTKPFLVGITQQFVSAGWRIYDPLTEDELRSFVEDPDTGKMQGSGAHDDNAISFMLACIGVLKLYRLRGIAFVELDSSDEVQREVMLPVIDITPVADVPKKIETTWRNEQGAVLIPFKDLFGKRKSVHA